MSDLVATNCGCGDNNGGCSAIIWLILLSCLCGNGNGSFFGGTAGCGNDNCLLLILLLCCCGNGNGFC